MSYDKLRRMIDESTEDTYTDVTLSGYLSDFDDDLNAVAAAIWSEKVAGMLVTTYDISADGADYTYSQKIDNAKELARYYSSKRQPKSSLWVKDPEETTDEDEVQ